MALRHSSCRLNFNLALFLILTILTPRAIALADILRRFGTGNDSDVFALCLRPAETVSKSEGHDRRSRSRCVAPLCRGVWDAVGVAAGLIALPHRVPDSECGSLPPLS